MVTATTVTLKFAFRDLADTEQGHQWHSTFVVGHFGPGLSVPIRNLHNLDVACLKSCPY